MYQAEFELHVKLVMLPTDSIQNRISSTTFSVGPYSQHFISILVDVIWKKKHVNKQMEIPFHSAIHSVQRTIKYLYLGPNVKSQF
jgi:hypothetical protein